MQSTGHGSSLLCVGCSVAAAQLATNRVISATCWLTLCFCPARVPQRVLAHNSASKNAGTRNHRPEFPPLQFYAHFEVLNRTRVMEMPISRKKKEIIYLVISFHSRFRWFLTKGDKEIMRKPGEGSKFAK